MSWPIVKLAEVCDIQMGSAPKGSSYTGLSEGIPLVAGASDYGELYPLPKKATTEPTQVCQTGDLIICVRATIGDLNWADKPYCLGRGVAGLRSKAQLDCNYLFYFIRANEHVLYENSTGSTFPQINKKTIENLLIPLPPVAIQKSIAEKLGKAEMLVKSSLQMESELNALSQAVFLEMFGDPFSNPLAWPKVTLGDIGEVQGGLQVTGKRSTLPLEVDYLRVANVYKNKLKLDEIKTIRVTQAELDRTSLKIGDMLVVEGHGNKNEIGRTAVWDGSIENCTHQNHLIRVRFDESVAVPEFVSRFLNSDGGRYQINKICNTTSGLNTISANSVRSLEVPLPPIHLQRKFILFFNDLSLQASKNLEIQEYIKNVFEALMQRSFSGKLDLKKVA